VGPTGARGKDAAGLGPGGRAFATLLAVAAVCSFLASPAAAQDDGMDLGGDDQIVLTGQLLIPSGQTVGSAVILDGDATVEGTVREDVVVLNGSAEISGTVGQDVVVLNGDAVIRSGAEIGGDLVTAGTPEVEPGATIRGERRGAQVTFDAELLGLAGRVAWWLAYSVSVLVLGLLLLAFGPRLGEAVRRTASTRTGASIGWGAGLFFLIPIGSVILAVTAIGLPLGISVLLGLALIYTVGYAVAAIAVGGLFLKPPTSRFLVFLLGWAILRAVGFVPFLGGLLWLAASAWGLGLLAVAARNRSSIEPSAERTFPPMPPAPVATP
jgi:hypothetical protein